MPNVLILGSEGNIGKAVRDSFAHLGFDVTTYDKVERPYDSDCRHHTNLDDAFRQKPDLVFSCLPYMHNELPALHLEFPTLIWVVGVMLVLLSTRTVKKPTRSALLT